MERLARLVMHHRLIVSLVLARHCSSWVASLPASCSDRLTLDFSLPGQPGDKAENAADRDYGASTSDTYVAVVTVPDGQTVAGSIRTRSPASSTTAAAAVPTRVLVVDFATTGDEGVHHRRRPTTYALVQGPIADVLRAAGIEDAARAGPGPGRRRQPGSRAA